jgi:imidazolonepropionase-like amidohydrolase
MRLVSFGRYVFVLALVCVCVSSTTAQERIAIKAGRLLDGTGSPAIENGVIVVKGDRIEAVGSASSVPIPNDARTIDLSNDTVMPGMINGHDHPTIRAYTGRGELNSLVQQLNEMGEPPAQQATRGVRDLRVDLLSGVTTEYVVGETGYNDVYLKQMADAGVFPAPRIYLSGPWIMPTGGYAPIPETNGPGAMRLMVRKNFEAGAHHIKILVSATMASGPNAGRSYGPKGTNFTKEEIDAVIDEVHRLGMKVTAHAIDADSIRFALEAGADSIQHASSLTPEIDDLFLKHKASIVNTYVAMLQASFTPPDFHFLDAEANSPQEWVNHARSLVDGVIAKNQKFWLLEDPVQEYLKKRYAQLKLAKDKGVPIAVGTDNMQGLLDLEIEHLVNAGFTPLEAISAATGTGAKALGIEQEVGTLQKGKFADIISVRGRPDQDIHDLSKINFVMVGGKTYSGLSFR